MKNILFLALLAFMMADTYAQVLAITETGDEVILYDDGTWKYIDADIEEEAVIPTNPNKFKKHSDASFLLKSKRTDIGFWLNPKKWSFSKSIDNPDAEYEVELKGEDLYGMIITEKIEIPLKTLKNIAVDNARLAAPDVYKVECMEMLNGLTEVK